MGFYYRTGERRSAPFIGAQPVRIEYVQGNVIGTLLDPEGCILHGTRSDQPYNKREEYDSTVNYVRNGTDGITGWNVTIAEDRYCEHMSPKQWGWNARGHSRLFIAAEFAQAKVGEPITDKQLDMFEHWWRFKVKPAHPNIPLFFINHSELEAGIADGKTDAARRGAEAEALRERIMERLS